MSRSGVLIALAPTGSTSGLGAPDDVDAAPSGAAAAPRLSDAGDAAAAVPPGAAARRDGTRGIRKLLPPPVIAAGAGGRGGVASTKMHVDTACTVPAPALATLGGTSAPFGQHSHRETMAAPCLLLSRSRSVANGAGPLEPRGVGSGGGANASPRSCHGPAVGFWGPLFGTGAYLSPTSRAPSAGSVCAGRGGGAERAVAHPLPAAAGGERPATSQTHALPSLDADATSSSRWAEADAGAEAAAAAAAAETVESDVGAPATAAAAVGPAAAAAAAIRSSCTASASTPAVWPASRRTQTAAGGDDPTMPVATSPLPPGGSPVRHQTHTTLSSPAVTRC